MTNSNFYTPTTKQFSLLELLAFYGYGVSADNSEVPTGGYVFYKKNNIKGKVLTMLGFDISKIVTAPATIQTWKSSCFPTLKKTLLMQDKSNAAFLKSQCKDCQP